MSSKAGTAMKKGLKNKKTATGKTLAKSRSVVAKRPAKSGSCFLVYILHYDEDTVLEVPTANGKGMSDRFSPVEQTAHKVFLTQESTMAYVDKQAKDLMTPDFGGEGYGTISWVYDAREKWRMNEGLGLKHKTWALWKDNEEAPVPSNDYPQSKRCKPVDDEEDLIRVKSFEEYSKFFQSQQRAPGQHLHWTDKGYTCVFTIGGEFEETGVCDHAIIVRRIEMEP